MNTNHQRMTPSIKTVGFFWFPGVLLVGSLIYAVVVLHPIAADNSRTRERLADLVAGSDRVVELAATLETLRREFEEESSSYRNMLGDFNGWYVEAHTYVNRTAAAVGLEVTEMEWSKPEPLTPAFETNQRRRWLRTSVFIKLTGAWAAHRDFSRRLSDCECLVQVVETRVTATQRAGQVEAAVSLFIYHSNEAARV